MRSGGLALYTLVRLLQAIPLLLGVIAVNFTLIQLAPGDPATILIGDYPAPEEYVAQVRREFGLGQILIVVFAVSLGWLPSQGNRSLRASAGGWAAFTDGLRYLLLPAVALCFRYLAIISRMTRASLLEVLGADFILAARSRGASEGTILFVHALRNAAAPIITVIGYNVGFV